MTESSKTKSKVKLLLGRPSPRCYIPAVEENNPKLPCKLVIPQHYNEYDAYQIMRDAFLRLKDYTHLVIATDDIVVLPEHIEQLQKDLEENDYPVLSGIMNVDLDDKVFVNICHTLPTKQRRGRKYNWITRDLLPEWDIFQAEFSGFPLMAIRRDIVERFEFRGDRVFEGLPPTRGASYDLVFCWDCKENGIPIYVDSRIDMLHLRTKGGCVINKEEQKVVFMN